LTTALAASGFVVGRRRVIAAMQHLGLEARRGDKPPERSNRKNSLRTFASREVVRCCRPDLVRRAFDVVIPNTVWVADVTHPGGDATQRYLCIIIDLASRRVVERWSPRKVIGEYIAWHNDVRLHSTLSYRSPREFAASEFGIPR